MKKNHLKTVWLHCVWTAVMLLIVCACKGENPEGDREDSAEDSPVADNVLTQMNRDIADMQHIAEGEVKVLAYTRESSGRFLIELDNGHVLTVYAEDELEENASVPLVGIDADGYWVYKLDGETENLKVANGQRASALSSTGKGVFTPQFRIGSKRFWEVTYDGSQWLQIGNRQVWDIEKKQLLHFLLLRIVF